MKTYSSPCAGVFRRPLLVSLLALGAAFITPALHAQAQYAGTYIGTLNTKVTVPGVTAIESSFGFYSATVSSTGAFDLSNGSLTGTVSASGAVTITGGSQFAFFSLTSATISGTTLSSAYGSLTAASNNTSQYKINASTGFTAAPGSGGGSGGSGGTVAAWQNGSFEGGPNPGSSWITLGAGSTVINGWSVVAGSIDYMGTAWPASAGSRSIDLSGSGAGTIAQTFTTTPGTAYTVTFDFAGNPGYGAGTGVKTLKVSVNNTNAVSTTYTFDTTGKTLSNLGWTTKTFTFTASAASTTLTFTSLDNSVYGPVIDNILLNGVSGDTGSAAAVAAGTTTVTGTTATVAPGNLTGYRNKVGSTYEFSVTGASSGSVWGTDVYTDDSSVARAAVHAGVVRVGETKVVTVTIIAGQGSYSASTRNAVTTSSWGAWSGSYSFAGGSGSSGTAVAVPALAVSAASVNVARSIAYGSSLVLTVPITGVGPFTYQWFLNGLTLQGATAATYSLASVTASNAGTYSVRVANSAGASTIAAGSIAVSGSTAGVPSFTLQPFNKIVSPGGTFALAASATGSGISYQWFRNGVSLQGETGSVILRNSANAGDAGNYTVRVSNSAGSLTSAPTTVSLDPNASIIANISVRVAATAGQIITPGFTISGVGKKRLLIRAVGPGLTPFGISAADVMADPKLTVFEGSTAIPGLNNNDWDASIASAFTAVGAFNLPTGSKDAAIVVELDASATGRGYTVQVTGNNNSAGIVLLEVYDLGNVTGASKLTNVSVLTRAGTGSSTLILGLVLKGSGQRTLLVRGVGPTLAAAPFNIGGTLVDPKLTIVDGNQRSIFSNLDWGQADYLSELVLATNFVGAFALQDQSKDAATLCLLESGSYTIPVVGQDDGTGTAIVEVYEVP
jgi:choice-of-anchor C domain-containing protein